MPLASSARKAVDELLAAAIGAQGAIVGASDGYAQAQDPTAAKNATRWSHSKTNKPGPIVTPTLDG